MNSSWFNIVQIVLSITLVLVILLQQKGAGVGGIFGGSSNIYSTKRGVDKVLFYVTIIISCLFFGLSLARLFF
ncbi:MAG: preprotein translocase subunit SecG [Candidatus Magasanikbacteria bacterium]|nr:preprotein translocase subunit SecG [Candidatus Magasanikbacteria bacterium]